MPELIDVKKLESLAQTEYASTIAMAVQQKTSKTRPFIAVETLTGEQKRYDKILPVEGREIENLYGATNPEKPDFNSRWLRTKYWDAAHVVAQQLLHQIGTEETPVPKIAMSQNAAKDRNFDKTIIEGIIGDAYEGKYGEIAVPFNEQYCVPVGYQYGTTYKADGMTFDKLLELRRILEESEAAGQNIDPQDEASPQIILLCSPYQLQQLRHDKRIASHEYSQRYIYDHGGEIVDVLGVRIVSMNSKYFPVGPRPLGTVKNPAAGDAVQAVRTCVAFCRGSVIAGQHQAIVRASELPEHKHNLQLYQAWDFGATRLEDKGVVKVDCLDVVAA